MNKKSERNFGPDAVTQSAATAPLKPDCIRKKKKK